MQLHQPENLAGTQKSRMVLLGLQQLGLVLLECQPRVQTISILSLELHKYNVQMLPIHNIRLH